MSLPFAATTGAGSPLASVVYPRGRVAARTTETKGLFVVLSQRTHSHGTSEHGHESGHTANRPAIVTPCLLYTSDAADEAYDV